MATVNLSSIITPANVLTASGTATLTNKTISGASNTLTNVPLTTGVTGTLPIANGGTGTTSTTFANLTTNVTGTLPVANGGTSLSTLTANNVVIGNGTSAPLFVAPSTSGNVLTSNGTTWASTAPAGGGSLIFLSSATATSSATVDLETTFNSTYDQYLITVSNMIPAINNREFGCKFKQNGAYVSTNYRCHTSQLLTSDALYNALISNAYAFVRLGDNVSNSFGSNYHLIVSSPTAVNNPSIFGHGTVFSATASVMTQVIPMGSQASTSGAIQGVRFLMDAGNITSGTFRLYGIKNS